MVMLTKNHAELTSRVEAHIAADAVIRGHYWRPTDNAVGGTGCFIGCLAHSSDAENLQELFGFPLPLVRIAESIFEDLPNEDGKEFFAAIPDAVGCDGKDLSRVHWAFLAAELRALPEVPRDIQGLIDPVIAGMDLLAGGGDWPDAARAYNAVGSAAAYATNRAYAAAARTAACAAACAAHAADVADAAARAAANADYAASYAAVRIRQRDTLLALIAEAGAVI